MLKYQTSFEEMIFVIVTLVAAPPNKNTPPEKRLYLTWMLLIVAVIGILDCMKLVRKAIKRLLNFEFSIVNRPAVLLLVIVKNPSDGENELKKGSQGRSNLTQYTSGYNNDLPVAGL